MRRIIYIHQLKDWPEFTWETEQLSQSLSDIRNRQGRLIGRMEGLGFSLQKEATLEMITQEVVKSSEIEGEMLDRQQVRSSVARRLGMHMAGLIPSDRNVEGVVEMAMDATQNFKKPLTQERLFRWHASLFPADYRRAHNMVVGKWRTNTPDDPMQVVSGAMGKERVHFEAPASRLLPKEMKAFLKWFESGERIDPVLKAAVAHLWFVTLHPFDDGNGRIARAIADMQLARADGIPQRFYSMSGQIRLMRKEYYDVLERTQKGTLDITIWLEWFLRCFDAALKAADGTLSTVLKKAEYWSWLSSKTLNERQKRMINKLLDGFDGKLQTSKWAKITKTSHDTAHRDILDLIEQGVLEKEPEGGRSTSYRLAEIPNALKPR